jgi:asparagine synthase (glutamine-hydrolysing)
MIRHDSGGLEVRVPFTDHRLVEYVWNVPWSMKEAGGIEKGLLRTAAADQARERAIDAQLRDLLQKPT